MRFEGVLSAWNPDAGYGSIRPVGGGDEVFVGLGAFPTDGAGPRLDERLSFEIVTGRDGRKQAVSLKRLQPVARGSVMREAVGVGQARVQRAQRKRRLGLAVGAVIAVMLVLGGVKWWPAAKADDVPVVMRR
ncbi:cold-shock protein [Roseateles sp. P5_E7]